MPDEQQGTTGERSGLTRDVLLLAGGGLVTAVFAYGARHHLKLALVALAVLAVLALVWSVRQPILRLRIRTLLIAGTLLVPFTALLGPVLGLPQAPQAFAFRVLLVALLFVGVTRLLVAPLRIRFAAKGPALLITAWFAWLIVGLAWAGDKSVGLRYIVVLLTMMLLLGATATAGATRRRLKALAGILVLAYLAIIGIALLESVTHSHLWTSRLATAVTSLTFAVTSVFVNENNLATYMAMCWPFMLLAVVFTRRRLYLAAAGLIAALSAVVFIHTGSRSTLLAVGLESLAALVLFRHLLPSRSSRAGKVLLVVAAVLLIGGASYLAFNNSGSAMLRRFRLSTLVSQAQAGSGSGAVRSNLTRRGLEIAGGSYLLGAGPGQAQVIIGQGTNALGITVLHDWWLECYADGGLIGLALQLGFFLAVIGLLWPAARGTPDPFLRYMAAGTVLALIGFSIGALGPSSSFDFAPMYVLYGLGLAIISRARLSAFEADTLPAAAARRSYAAALRTALSGLPARMAPLARGWWLVATLILVGIAAAGLLSLAAPKLYTATSAVYIGMTTDANDNPIVNPTANLKTDSAWLSDHATLVEAARRTGQGMKLGRLRRELAVSVPTAAGAQSSPTVNFVTISVTDTKGRRAAGAANALAALLLKHIDTGASARIALFSEQIKRGQEVVAAALSFGRLANAELRTIAQAGGSAAQQAAAALPWRALAEAAASEQSVMLTSDQRTQLMLLMAHQIEQPSLLHAAAAPTTPSGSGDKLPVADGALAGLVIGLIVASLRERRRGVTWGVR